MSLKSIAQFDNPFYAELAKGRLESEGIHVYLKDGNLVSITQFSNAFGGVKLMVNGADVVNAINILQNSEFSASEIEILQQESELMHPKKSRHARATPAVCPKCDSSEYKRSPLHEFFALIYAALGLSPPRFIKRFKCKRCGTKWS